MKRTAGGGWVRKGKGRRRGKKAREGGESFSGREVKMRRRNWNGGKVSGVVCEMSGWRIGIWRGGFVEFEPLVLYAVVYELNE